MTNFSSPVPKGCRFTSGFMTKTRPNHAGDDWAPPAPGQRGVKIYAGADGTVRRVGRNIMPGHTGLAVLIDLGKLTDKFGTDRMEIYTGHMATVSVKAGDKVKAGQVIGVMGATGNAQGIHCHLGVLCNGKWIAPTEWFARKGVQIGKDSPKTAAATVHTVKPGETLSGIAKANGTTVAALLKLNPAIAKADPKGNVIQIGQKVKLR
ncbi:lysin A [Arthrobacter phage Atraxa]|uniref:Lysin A n=1 Tax=Arthrobacter phage Atraxa TaxID=2419947 RepID=A0A3G2KD90_9CAUD|nr:endolysin [Arthrobacter phage Atraxa]AYN56968.1 lysin A [Arthrobacter phage Atraxa]AYN59076.1 lysin A [Arthrobacter phage Sputnik]